MLHGGCVGGVVVGFVVDWLAADAAWCVVVACGVEESLADLFVLVGGFAAGSSGGGHVTSTWSSLPSGYIS